MLTTVKNCVIVESTKNLINMFTDKCDGNVLGSLGVNSHVMRSGTVAGVNGDEP